jgi:hypothetical protein
MTTHNLFGDCPTMSSELKMTIALNSEQAVPLHPSNRLRDSRATLLKSFGDPGAQWTHTFFF